MLSSPVITKKIMIALVLMGVAILIPKPDLSVRIATLTAFALLCFYIIHNISRMAREIKAIEGAKQATLSALEDAHAAELKEKKQGEELRRALLEIKRIASIAERERGMYVLLLSSIGDGVLVLDIAHTITVLNDAGARVLGFHKDELVGKHFERALEFFQKDGVKIDSRVLESVLAPNSTQTFPLEVSVKRKDGSLLPIAPVFSPIYETKRNEFKGVIISFRDALLQRNLEETRISFISVASHQLRTPLTSMRWFTEMLMGGDAGKLNEDQYHFIKQIYQGIDRMIRLVNLLLQIARVEARHLKVLPTPTSLKEITEAVVLSLKIIDAKGQYVEILADPDPFPMVPMDQEILWQVIQNLLTNASRYSREGATITVKLTEVDGMIDYAVIDNGIGIPDADKSKIFEKFYRAENAIKYIPEGSGLGLSLVQSLVSGWGGTITFDSKEGEGSTFHVRIPKEGMRAQEGDVAIVV